jgi:hypothetical protein
MAIAHAHQVINCASVIRYKSPFNDLSFGAHSLHRRYFDAGIR